MSKAKKRKFNDCDIRSILETSAPISNYYVAGGLRCYCDPNGQIMLVMDDDDDFNDACIEYLKKQGMPEFENSDDEEIHVKFLQARTLKSH